MRLYTHAPELTARVNAIGLAARLAVTRNDFGTVCAYGCLVPVAFVMMCAES